MDEINKRCRIVSKQKNDERRVDITVTDEVYDGVLFRIDKARYASSGEKGLVKIENLNGKICVTKGNLSDKKLHGGMNSEENTCS